MFRTTNMHDATAGCKKMLPTDEITLIAKAMGEIDDPIDFAFMQGFCVGLNFPTVPKSSVMYGSDIADYSCNALCNVKKELVRQAIADGHVGVTIIELGCMVGSPDEPKSDADGKPDDGAVEGDAE